MNPRINPKRNQDFDEARLKAAQTGFKPVIGFWNTHLNYVKFMI